MDADKIRKYIIDRYIEKTSGSRRLLEEAKKYLPGGDTRSAAYFEPNPFFTRSGKGYSIFDVDGNEYVDFVNNFTSLIHGHAYPPIVEAVKKQAEAGLVHGTPIESQFKLAKLLCERVPGVELLRFCNSGSEATLFAMRAARAFSGKSAFIRMDGGYNGCHDFAEVNITPDFKTEDKPRPKAEKGVPASVTEEIYVVPFNDLDAAENILKKYHDRIAGIIMEPMMGAGGGVVPEDGYIKGMRELADKFSVILILDEIITFRLNEGGLQTLLGVKADITTFGKIMGGGCPIGAFGGRRDIMDMFNVASSNFVQHSGTFSGNAVAMEAGLAAMENYNRADIERINSLGEMFSDGIIRISQDLGVPVQINGLGSMICPLFADKKMRNAREVVLNTMKSNELKKLFHIEMLNRGMYFVERGLFCISTPMDEMIIKSALKEYEESLALLKPISDRIFNSKE